MRGWVFLSIQGPETALFLRAATTASGSSTQPLAGATLGLGTAVLLGVLVYCGAVWLDLGKFLRWTGGLLVFVATGVLSYGVHDLHKAGIRPDSTGWPSMFPPRSPCSPCSSWRFAPAIRLRYRGSGHSGRRRNHTDVTSAPIWVAARYGDHGGPFSDQ